jgi:hypothetical protein
MAHASKKHLGAGSQGKGDGSGGLAPPADIPENMALSNRDKAQHPTGRGQDGKWIQAEQGHDSELNQNKK